MESKVTVYEIVNELEWVKYSLKSAKKYAGMDFKFVGVGWNIPADTKEWLADEDYQVLEFPDQGDFITNLYTGWRRGFEVANTDIVVPIAGDMVFYKDWLKNLVKHAAPDKIINCTLVERGAMPSYHICKDFGIPPKFRERDFHLFAKALSVDILDPIPEILTAKPYACFKSTYWDLGGEPLEIQNGVTGDVFFIREALKKGIKIFRAKDSVVVHWQRAKEKRFSDVGQN